MTMESGKIKVILVDDNETFRNAEKIFLQNELNCQILSEFSNGLQFLNSQDIHQADIVLMDIQMPEMDGVTATKNWCLLNPRTKVIAVTMFSDKAYLVQLIEAGFKGFIFKAKFFDEIAKAFDVVINGGLYFNDEIPL